MTKVEIIVTIGPKSINDNILTGLKEAGATSYRINLSHSNPIDLDNYFTRIRNNGIKPSIDTQGAQLRVEELPDIKEFKEGQEIVISFSQNDSKSEGRDKDPEAGSRKPRIVLNHPEVNSQMEAGDKLKIDFTGLVVKLTNKYESYWLGEVIAGGTAMINRAVDIQGKAINLSPLTKFDIDAIEYALEKGCDEIFASFISSAEDVKLVRSVIGPKTKLISKIESARGVANAQEIIDTSDAILIDRGDLSREISIASVPMAVRSIVNLAKQKSRPVYVATNVLDSMMTSQLPSRAEISDVYTLLNSGVTGLVLAAEVAIGENPVESTALVDYLVRLYRNHKIGLHGIGKIDKPSKKLIGEQLYNWL